MYVKFGYLRGYSLVFAAFQPNGTGRGIEQQPLTEVRPTGYYQATPLTDLESGDAVLVYVRESVLWEDAPVYISTESFVYYEGEKVHWEGKWVVSYDDLISASVTWVGDPIGADEYRIEAIESSIEDLVGQGGTVTNVYNEVTADREPQVLTSLGNIGVIGRGDC